MEKNLPPPIALFVAYRLFLSQTKQLLERTEDCELTIKSFQV